MHVLGDDGLHVMRLPWGDEDDVAFCGHLKIVFSWLGLTADPVIYRRISDVTFASHLLVPDHTGRWRMTPMPGRVVSKMGYRRVGPLVANLAADVACVWNDAAHMPILNVYLKALKRLTSGVAPKGIVEDYDYKIHAGAIGAPGEETWAYVYSRY